MAYYIVYLAPLAMAAAAVLAFRGAGMRPAITIRFSKLAALLSVATTACAGLLLVLNGPGSAAFPLPYDLGPGVRVDALSVTMMGLVSLVGWVVLRYSARYLDGEANQGSFTGNLCAALASVQLLVQAGTLTQLLLGWLAIGYFLQKLLLFYPERLAARRAARKEWITARIADITLLIGAMMLFAGFGTGDLDLIAKQAAGGDVATIALLATAPIAVAAVVKSAQLPLHGWLTEVMEAPTPVSALLHAGIINAGGFLLVRFADLFILTPLTLALLAILGGLSALFASVVMLTQSSVKTSLAWSTISQMGFMVLQCGLGLFSLAMLHIVAHSLYKAHAFLASGEAVERIASIRRPGPIAVPDMAAVAKAFLLASGIYIAVGAAFGLTGKPPQAIALGLILIFGVAYLLAQGLADAAPRQLTVRTAFYSLAVALGYFTLHSIAEKFYGGLLPQPLPVGDLETAVIILALISFGTVALAQAALPLWAGHPAVTGLRVHLSNGVYLSAVFNRLMGGWTLARDAR